MTKVIDSDKPDEIDIRRIESNGELDILPNWPERANFVFSVIERIRKNTTKDSGFENKAIWLAKAENNPQVLKHLVLNPKVKERMNIREKSQKSRFFFKIRDPGKIKNLIETCFSIIQDARDYNTDYENVFYNGKIDDLERLFNFFTYIYYRIDEKEGLLKIKEETAFNAVLLSIKNLISRLYRLFDVKEVQDINSIMKLVSSLSPNEQYEITERFFDIGQYIKSLSEAEKYQFIRYAMKKTSDKTNFKIFKKIFKYSGSKNKLRIFNFIGSDIGFKLGEKHG